MTAFGIYLIIVYFIGIAVNIYFVGRGGAFYGPDALIVGAIWGSLNVAGIIFLGTGLGV